MKLPCTLESIKKLNLSRDQLETAVIERRAIIRYHREQRMDHRCWLDDLRIWEMTDLKITFPKVLPPFKKMMARCADFYEYRRTDEPDTMPIEVIRDPSKIDLDLNGMGKEDLIHELVRLQKGILAHFKSGIRKKRTYNDDRLLYALLPDKKPADFRLPPRDQFLGEAAAPKAGCPSFWKSHQNCPKTCDLKTWGPC